MGRIAAVLVQFWADRRGRTSQRGARSARAAACGVGIPGVLWRRGRWCGDPPPFKAGWMEPSTLDEGIRPSPAVPGPSGPPRLRRGGREEPAAPLAGRDELDGTADVGAAAGPLAEP